MCIIGMIQRREMILFDSMFLAYSFNVSKKSIGCGNLIEIEKKRYGRIKFGIIKRRTKA